eukprot:5883178-Pyramimonas_sp.AAC.1
MRGQRFTDFEEGVSAGAEVVSWMANLLHNRMLDDASECRRYYITFDDTTVPRDVDALLDSLSSNYVLDMLLTFPTAKVIMTTRPPEAWVSTRLLRSERGCEPVEPPIQERCARKVCQS